MAFYSCSLAQAKLVLLAFFELSTMQTGMLLISCYTGRTRI